VSPIFEADLPATEYAYRRGRGAPVHVLLNTGYVEAINTDMSDDFASIPPVRLPQSQAHRISDQNVLAMIKAMADGGRRGRRRAWWQETRYRGEGP